MGKTNEFLEKYINWITGISLGIVVLMVVNSFVLSFDATAAEAAQRFTSERLSRLVPFSLEGAIIVFLLWGLFRAMLGESRWAPTLLVLMFTVLSVAINVSHAKFEPGGVTGDNVLTAIFAGSIPVSLFIAFEVLVSIVKSVIFRHTAVRSLANIKNAMHEANERLNTITRQVEERQAKWGDELKAKREAFEAEMAEFSARLQEARTQAETAEAEAQTATQRERERLAVELAELKKQIAEARAEANLSDAERFLLMYVANNPDASQADISRVIGRASSTVSSYVRNLTDDGYLHKNGHGWEVLKDA